MSFKKSIVIEIESELFRAEYHGRHKSLLLVCKKAQDNNKVLKFEDVKPYELEALSSLVAELSVAIKQDQNG